MKPRLVCGNKMSLMRCLTPKKSGDRHRFLETFLRKLEREKFQALEGSEILQAENKRLRAQACEWLGRNQGETTTSWETYTIHHTICNIISPWKLWPYTKSGWLSKSPMRGERSWPQNNTVAPDLACVEQKQLGRVQTDSRPGSRNWWYNLQFAAWQ